MDDRDERCCFGEWAVADARRALAGKRVRGITRDLVDALDVVGLAGRTILDLGCGAGGLAIEAVVRGASSATGIDLSDVAIDEATRLSEQSGTGSRTSFRVGDGAVDPLEAHDVVVLNRVFCCYRGIDGLLANSIPAAGSVYAFTIPPSSGWRGAIARVTVSIGNAWYRFRRSRFRAFVHDLGTIDRVVGESGFREVVSRRRLTWDLRVYVRGDPVVGALGVAAVTHPRPADRD